ncbi:TPA: NADH-quinone oxidoreductase subunit M, partial [Campylobacter jejuni]|nr:NADH-quinone oxidoreductase subunit M [Campylobacter jejuni]
LYQRYHTYDISFYYSLAKKAPLFSIFFMLILLASVSLPLTVSFVGEFLILLGIAKINLFYALLAGLVIILGAIYMFAVFRKIFFMQKQSFIENFSLRFREIVALVCIVVMIFGLGLMPNILLKPIQKDVDNLIKTMNIRAVEQNTLDFLSKIGEANVK